ncbi:MAG: flagellar M-ring protein FliF [Treponemataceae bacterium]|nr:flagellar M-ring protein FliF [Treponemataceae bacterium]
MNEWFKKVIGQIKDLWSKWKVSQKIIFFAIIAVVIVALVLVITLSTRSTEVVLFNVATSEDKSSQIIMRLSEDGIEAKTNPAGLITVKDNATARKAKGILFREGIVDDFDPWVLFDTERWSTTDFERDVNLQRSIQAQLKKFIESYDDVDNAEVIISMPKKTVYTDSQDPVGVSVILTLKPGSTMAEDKRAIRGMQNLILKSVAGLKEENIKIATSSGIELNDFEGMKDLERVDITKREQKLLSDLQKEYRNNILSSIQKNYGEDRVRSLDINISMDMSEVEENKTEYTPVVINEDNKDTPYDDSKKQDSITLSSEQNEKTFTGFAVSPEGPAGVEGQTPAVYADMQNYNTKSTEKSLKKNEAVNSKQTYTKIHPEKGKRTVSVAIDGTWEFEYDENGNYIIKEHMRQRKFIPATPEELAGIERIIKGAIGYDKNRGDFVEVVPVKIERTSQFMKEDAQYEKAKNTKKVVFFVLIGVVVVLAAFLLIRFIIKEMERKRRQKEEELLRQQQLEREKVIWDAEQAEVNIPMSVEDKHKAELQDSAISAAKDHPEDVAQLIRTWLMEE